MVFCVGCGKLLGLGVIKDGSPTGHSFEGIIVQPVKDGAVVHCVGCYGAKGVAANFPNANSIQAKGIADFPAAAQETKDQWRTRLAQRAGKKIDAPDLVAAFDALGI